MQLAVTFQTFNGDNGLAGTIADGHAAGSNRLAVDQHGARPALAFPAAVFAAGQAKIIAQNAEQRARRISVEAALGFIHLEFRYSHRCLLQKENEDGDAKCNDKAYLMEEPRTGRKVVLSGEPSRVSDRVERRRTRPLTALGSPNQQLICRSASAAVSRSTSSFSVSIFSRSGLASAAAGPIFPKMHAALARTSADG